MTESVPGSDWSPPPSRAPRWADIRPYLALQLPSLRLAHRLERAATVWDLRRMASRRVPRPVFDYVDGGAMGEVTLGRTRDAYRGVTFHPRVLRDVTSVDTRTTVQAIETAMPLCLAPTGFTRMMHHEGEAAVAWAAKQHGLVYTLSTLGTTSPKDLAAAVPGAVNWFQLYVDRDRTMARELLAQAKASGFRVVVLTVDTAVGGTRLRDVRNGLSIPPRLSPRALLGIVSRPLWWVRLLTHEPLRFAAMDSTDGTVGELLTRMLDPTLDMRAVDWVLSEWDGPVVVKGVQTVEDALRLEEAGVHGIILSNHGGRQLDRAVTTLELLPAVREALAGELELYVDGGIMSGADAAAALALGADAVFVGRAYLYGLMAGGHLGVFRALEILRREFVETMRLLGVTSVNELTADLVTIDAARPSLRSTQTNPQGSTQARRDNPS